MASSNQTIPEYFYHVTNVEIKAKKTKEKVNYVKSWKYINAYIIYKSKYHTKLSHSFDLENNLSKVTTEFEKIKLEQTSTTSEENIENRIDIKCAFVSTTLFNNGLPTFSTYPSEGKKDTLHMRCRLPFKILIENYPECWFWCKKDIQIHYICGKTEDIDKIEDAMKYGYNDKPYKNKKDFIVNKLIKDGTPDMTYKKFVYNERNKTANILPLIQNEYDKDGLFYNIAVCGDIPLNDEDIEWDSVKKRNVE